MSFISQRGATGPLPLRANGTFQSSTDANLATLVGTRWDLSDGREVILVSTAAATTVAPGYLYQDAAIVANHQDLVVSAFSAYSGTTGKPATVTVTLGGTAATLNQYQGGFAIVNSGTGIGQTLRVSTNTAQTSTVGSVVVTLEDAPNTALVAGSSKVSLIPAHGANVIVNPTTPTNIPVGIALYAIAASSYGFLVSKGLTAALSDVSVATVGKAIAASVTTAGATTLATATVGSVTSTVIGNTAQTAVSAETRAVFVNL